MKDFLYEHLNIDLSKKEVISFVGGGGKTTTMFSLAEELKLLGKKVLITTTTKIFVPDKKSYDNLFLNYIDEDKINPGTISIFGEKIENGKINEVNTLNLENIIKRDLFDLYLIEADGAKHKPIKAPNDYEPIITNSTSKTIGLIGLDALHRNVSETSHRPELLLNILEKVSSDNIEIEDIVNLTLHKKGLFKDSRGESILLLNKAMDGKTIGEAKTIKEKLNEYKFNSVVVADVLSNSFY